MQPLPFMRRNGPWHLLLCLAVILSCTGGGRSYSGRQANPENVVRLIEGDVRELAWQTNDLGIHLTYSLVPGRLDLVGQVSLQSRLAHYPVVDYLRIDLHALDSAGTILASYPLWYAGTGRDLHFVNWAFERHYAVPAGTGALTFSYSGRMRDGGRWGTWRERDDVVTWDFWHTP